jgi:hypothetical protein
VSGNTSEIGDAGGTPEESFLFLFTLGPTLESEEDAARRAPQDDGAGQRARDPQLHRSQGGSERGSARKRGPARGETMSPPPATVNGAP